MIFWRCNGTVSAQADNAIFGASLIYVLQYHWIGVVLPLRDRPSYFMHTGPSFHTYT